MECTLLGKACGVSWVIFLPYFVHLVVIY